MYPVTFSVHCLSTQRTDIGIA